MICPKCAQSLPDEARFCYACGAELERAPHLPDADDPSPPPQEPAPTEAGGEPPPTYCEEDAPEPPLDNPPVKRRKRRLLPVLILLFGLVAAAVGVYQLGLRDLPLPLPKTNIPAEAPPPKEEPSAAGVQPPLSSAEPMLPALELTAWSDEAASPPFPQVNAAYHYVQEDENHVYFLGPPTLRDLPNALYRMGKDGSSLTMVLNLEPALQQAEIAFLYSFALHGDYIYFCSQLNSGKSGYFRTPKAGGDTELLFISSEGFMVPYGDEIYILFRLTNELGVYRPGVDERPRTVTELLIDHPGAVPLNAFSIVNNALFYGALLDDRNIGYYRLDLVTGEQDTLLAPDHAGNMVLSALWLEDAAYYVRYDYGDICYYWMRMPHGGEPEQVFSVDSQPTDSIMQAVRVEEFFLYQNGDRYMWAPLDNPNDSSIKVTDRNPFIGVSDGWMVFSDFAWPVEERADPVVIATAADGLLSDLSGAYAAAMEASSAPAE